MPSGLLLILKNSLELIFPPQLPLVALLMKDKERLGGIVFELGIGPEFLISAKEFDAHGELPEREPYFNTFTMSAIAGIGYTFWDVLTFSARFNYSIIPIRDHPSGQSYLLKQGQYSHVLSFAVYYKISGKNSR